MASEQPLDKPAATGRKLSPDRRSSQPTTANPLAAVERWPGTDAGYPLLIDCRHCERSEAIHLSRQGKMDCFAALAMTRIDLRDNYALAANS